MSTCRSCGAVIQWAKTARNVIPLDAEPSEKGNILIHGGLAHVMSRADVLAALDRNEDAVFYLPHFATCPNAAAHRKAR